MAYIRGIFYSLPLQLLLLHFRKYQVLLFIWFILFSAVHGTFLKTFGAESLFLAPEYLGNVNALSTALMGVAIGIFIMSWNITTFILFSRHFTFLAATQFPFLKYCFNNSVIPIAFLIFFLIRGYQFAHYTELIPNTEIIFLTLGFLLGLLFVLFISFLYFFRADKSILRNLQPLFSEAKKYIAQLQPDQNQGGKSLIRSEWFLDSFVKVRRCRDVSHYSAELMEKIFQRHHFAAVICIFIAYAFLIFIGFFLDHKAFQIPAAASITLFFAVLIGVSGAFTYFFQSWSVPMLLAFLVLLNVSYRQKWIDPSSKAYGLSYDSKTERPIYSAQSLQELSSPAAIAQDQSNMVQILEKWKAKQTDPRPLLVIIGTSGGGSRSATFTVNALQKLDSAMGGQIMNKTFLITGASGGMIGAAYFRELYRMKINGNSINLQDPQYIDNISGDLLNPTFSSFVARDIFAPEQRFSVGPYSYLKDRGYSFELALNNNTQGILDKRLKDYTSDEFSARIPLIFFHNVITRDGKKMLISTQPLRFMMRPASNGVQHYAPDAVDYTSFFAKQDPHNLRLLTTLRMNATFPVILPNVWLPTNPVIDVMDGGLRDNYGVETALRFISTMQNWIKENTKGVLLIQLRDRMDGGWEHPYDAENVTENAVKPFFLLQYNWYKMMEYSQSDMASYMGQSSEFPIQTVTFQYTPVKEENKAALSFHLSQREKRDIAASLYSPINRDNFALLKILLDSNQLAKDK